MNCELNGKKDDSEEPNSVINSSIESVDQANNNMIDQAIKLQKSNSVKDEDEMNKLKITKRMLRTITKHIKGDVGK